MTKTVKTALQRLAALETATAELTLRIDSLSKGLARVLGIAERAAASADSSASRLTAQGEKLQRVLLDGEGNRRDLKELRDSVGVSVDDLTESLKEVRRQINDAAYVHLGVDYAHSVVRESAATMIKRVAEAVGVELVAAPPINKPGMIHARKPVPPANPLANAYAPQEPERKPSLWRR